ncbi:MAG: hypothetical protein K9W46_07030 [Candidatus Heimdallarchaeum endolithica]|uniref:Uncharacterized protein n=1 Tax=Candidatus Heimdallarchaeum endolithica TaxID=2876572 RepID=A0A9Y1BTU8_9ARCH|nr:MAG: hypothetical protein K9W46_07030 [Candidatus Heimdallarchaeum endolithica]
MRKSRSLSNIFAIFIGVVAIGGIGYLGSYLNIGWIVLVGIFVGALLIGFFAYGDDGVKLAVIFGFILVVLGIITAVILYTQFGQLTGSADNIAEAIGNIIGGILLLVLAIFAFIGSIVVAVIMAIGSVIGRAIGRSVWDEKERQTAKYAEMVK